MVKKINIQNETPLAQIKENEMKRYTIGLIVGVLLTVIQGAPFVFFHSQFLRISALTFVNNKVIRNKLVNKNLYKDIFLSFYASVNFSL